MKRLLLASALVLFGSVVPACETSDPTQAVFDNRYPSNDAAATHSVVLYKGWWSVAQLTASVLAGAESDPVRVVEGSDFAYGVLAIDWDPTSGAPPITLLPVRTKTKLTAARGDTLHIQISDATVSGNCLTGTALSQADADIVTQRIFPAEFVGQSYDASTCALSPVDGGAAGAGGQRDIGAGGEAGAGQPI
jgi:hypothetical protein